MCTNTTELINKNIRHKYKICALSFVGRNNKPGSIRESARIDLLNRLKSGQIDIGILVFERGNSKNRNIFTNYCSKAWVNYNIYLGNINKNRLFVDDGEDHILSTKHILNINNANNNFNTYYLTNRNYDTDYKNNHSLKWVINNFVN